MFEAVHPNCINVFGGDDALEVLLHGLEPCNPFG